MKKGEKKKEEKTKANVTEGITNNSCFTLILSQLEQQMSDLTMYKNHLWRGLLLLNHQTYSEKTFIPTGTPIYLNIYRKKSHYIQTAWGQKGEKKSGLRTESTNSLPEIIIRQIINI